MIELKYGFSDCRNYKTIRVSCYKRTVLVMLNPTNRYGTKAEYTELRKFLAKDGYIKLQSEVFMRIENSKKNCQKHENRIKPYLPSTGEVRMLILTEKQFENCILFQEKEDVQEKLVGAKNLVTL